MPPSTRIYSSRCLFLLLFAHSVSPWTTGRVALTVNGVSFPFSLNASIGVLDVGNLAMNLTVPFAMSWTCGAGARFFCQSMQRVLHVKRATQACHGACYRAGHHDARKIRRTLRAGLAARERERRADLLVYGGPAHRTHPERPDGASARLAQRNAAWHVDMRLRKDERTVTHTACTPSYSTLPGARSTRRSCRRPAHSAARCRADVAHFGAQRCFPYVPAPAAAPGLALAGPARASRRVTLSRTP